MRLNTAKRYSHLFYLYVVLVLLLLFDFISHELSDGTTSEGFIMWPFIAALFLFFIYRGNPVFVYDSDGEVIILKSNEPSLQKLFKPCNKLYEFPKRKLIGYSFSRLPFRKKLILRLESKEGTTKKVSVMISYVNKQETKDLERSLRSTLSKNKKAKQRENAE